MALLAAAALLAVAPAADRPLDYNRDIRQLLSENCFSCHGQDATRRKAKLRLDVAEEACRARDGHAAIVPGKPQESALIARITSRDEDDLMPPPDSNRTLTRAQIAALTRWIAEGATYQPHWSFIPPGRPLAPEVSLPDWPRQPLDRFVLARLDALNLAPAPAAAPVVWLRRASLDLTGLPPAPAELDAFAAAAAHDGEAAWAAATDRLLASPRFGERMAQDWLDLARYADTHGFNNDSARSMWRWRDWVISAYNTNLPYDRFITEQLAGDLLSAPSLEQRIATGFGRNHVINSEGGIIGEEYRVEYVADRVRTLGMAWLGLTLECARCHDHKYDPLTQRDYYRMFAFFNNVDEAGEDGRVANAAPIMPAPTAEQQARLAELDGALKVEEAALAGALAPAATTPWRALARLAFAAEPASAPMVALGLRGCTGVLVNDADPAAAPLAGGAAGGAFQEGLGAIITGGAPGLDLAAGAIDLAKPWSFACWVRWPGGEGPLFSSMAYAVNPAAGSYGAGNEVRVTAAGAIEVRRAETWPHYAIQAVSVATLAPGVWQHVVVTCSGAPAAAGMRIYIDGGECAITVLHDDLNGRPGGVPRLAADRAQPPRGFPGELGGVRFYQEALAGERVAAWSTGVLAGLLCGGQEQAARGRLAWARAAVACAADPANAAHARRRDELLGARRALERALPSTMVMAEMAAPRQAHVLTRGRYDAPAAAVEPGVPEVLSACWPAGAPANRLGLARWLTSPEHPLTARVVVNRMWAQLFGTGLVKTVEDFGRQGEYPSHPELLDWLAREFVESGWDVKHMLKVLVLSATYRQDSVLTPLSRERDAENRLLARGPRLRLSAEMIRDQALLVSGLLVERVGGASVFPYQPADLYKGIVVDAPYPGTVWTVGSGADLYRRSLYTFWKRTVPHPVLSVLDVPDREVCSARRARTNTPLQALTLMNETGFVEAGRALAQRMLSEGGSDDGARIAFAMRLATGREPAARELDILTRLLAQLRASYRADPAAARLLLSVGAAPVATPAAGEGELAAHAALAGMILNLDATLTKN